MKKTKFIQVMIACCVTILTNAPLFASDYSSGISEAFLRTEFVFKVDEKLKYSQCEEKRKTTCSYVWGIESSKDAARIKAGLAPKGHKLLVIYVQAKGDKDFQRVIGSYSDAVAVEELGERAVWSEKRKQISLMTEKNLIVHVNLSAANINSKEKANAVAKEVLGNLAP